MRRLERSIEAAACRAVKTRFDVESVKFEPPGSDGWPDRLFFIHGGRPLLVEFKRPGEVLAPLQLYRHCWLKEMGYDVVACWSVEECLAEVRLATRRAAALER